MASGHEGIGITTALVSAELLAHHLPGPRPPWTRPFLPAAGASAMSEPCTITVDGQPLAARA